MIRTTNFINPLRCARGVGNRALALTNLSNTSKTQRHLPVFALILMAFTSFNLLSKDIHTSNDVKIRYNPLLIAEKVSEESEVRRIASVWKKVAQEKSALASCDEKQQFTDCVEIADSFAYAPRFVVWNDSTHYICKDEKGNAQAMMSLKLEPERVYVSLLVTNPINISSRVNRDEPHRVRGAGTALLQKAEDIALQEGKSSVYLIPYSSAVPFYEKNGFCFDGRFMKKTFDQERTTVDLSLFATNLSWS